MKMHLKHVVYVILSLISFVLVFYSAGKFMVFLSVPYKLTSNFQNESVFWPLLVNMLLLSSFMLQHTLMVLPQFKHFLHSIGLNVVSRSIYNLFTSVLLLALIKYWKVSDIILWNFDTHNTAVWYFFNAVHLFAWSIVYTGCLFMDISEILGVKQVYYSIRRMPDPMAFKSPELQRLYGHTRHPSFSAFSIIFWIYPAMTLDRFLLALVLTAYMYIAWKTDKYDLHYQKTQYIRKNQELSRLH